MNSLKCSTLRLQPYRQWIFVLYFVLLTICDFSCTVDGLSTTNERGMYSNTIFFFIKFLLIVCDSTKDILLWNITYMNKNCISMMNGKHKVIQTDAIAWNQLIISKWIFYLLPFVFPFIWENRPFFHLVEIKFQFKFLSKPPNGNHFDELKEYANGIAMKRKKEQKKNIKIENETETERE